MINTRNNNPPRTVSFIPVIGSTSGRLHSEFIRLLFLQTHRETDLVFTVSGVQLPEHDRGLFHFRHTTFSTHLKVKVENTLTTDTVLRFIYWWDTYHFKCRFLRWIVSGSNLEMGTEHGCSNNMLWMSITFRVWFEYGDLGCHGRSSLVGRYVCIDGF
jgi:hypothetical protein